MSVFINVQGQWREVTDPSIQLGGEHVALMEVLVNVSGTWHAAWQRLSRPIATPDTYLVDAFTTAAQLNEALAALRQGGTLLFGEGLWQLDEPLLVRHSGIRLIGSPGGTSRLQTAGNFGQQGLVQVQGTATTRLADITIEGLDLDGNAGSGRTSIGLTAEHADRVRIDRCRIYNHTYPGIRFLRAVRESEISDNGVSGNMNAGILLEAGSDDCLLSGNTVANNAERGITVTASRHTLLTDNLVRNNGNAGIRLESRADNALLLRNRVTHNGADGIQVVGSFGVLVAQGLSTLNGEHGLYGRTGTDDLLLFGNSHSGNLWSGAKLVDSGQLAASGNVFSGNRDDGLSATGNTSVTVAGNQLTGNVSQQLELISNAETINDNIS